MAATKRIIKELAAYQADPSPDVLSLQPETDDDLTRLVARIRGPPGTAYEGGIFTISVTLPPTYPTTPPTLTFVTRACHANVSFTTGEICLDLLTSAAWTPTYGVVSALEAVVQLLAAGGEPDSPLNVDLARLLREGDLVGAQGLVRLYTRIYAMGS